MFTFHIYLYLKLTFCQNEHSLLSACSLLFAIFQYILKFYLLTGVLHESVVFSFFVNHVLDFLSLYVLNEFAANKIFFSEILRKILKWKILQTIWKSEYLVETIGPFITGHDSHCKIAILILLVFGFFLRAAKTSDFFPLKFWISHIARIFLPKQYFFIFRIYIVDLVVEVGPSDVWDSKLLRGSRSLSV